MDITLLGRSSVVCRGPILLLPPLFSVKKASLSRKVSQAPFDSTKKPLETIQTSRKSILTNTHRQKFSDVLYVNCHFLDWDLVLQYHTIPYHNWPAWLRFATNDAEADLWSNAHDLPEWEGRKESVSTCRWCTALPFCW